MASQNGKPEGTEQKKNQVRAKPKQSIKNRWLYIGTVGILVLTIVAFVFIPSVGGSFSRGSAPQFGSWNGKPISYTADSYFAGQVARINEYLRQQGLSEQNFQLYAYQVWNMAFQSAAIRAGLMDTVQKTGFVVTDKGLDEAVAKNDAFLADGVFSIDKYNATPMSTRQKIRNTTREDLYVRRYYEDLYSVSPSTAEIEFVASMAKPQRSIDYTAVSLADYPDSEAAAWGEKHPELFRSLSVSQISITSSEADAKKILSQVKENKLSFEDAAKSHSQDSYADKGGDAGSLYYHSFAASFPKKEDAEKIAALGKGEISGICSLGEKHWAFFRINAPLSEPDFTKQATVEEVKSYIFEMERGTLEDWAIAKAGSLSGTEAAGDFKVLARKAGMEVKSAGPILINIGTPTFYAYGQQIPLFQSYQYADPALMGAEEDESFLAELFSVKKGGISSPKVLGDSVIVFSVTGDEPAPDDETAMVKFSYPYFHQQLVDSQTRDTFLKSKKFRNDFNTAFFKIYSQSAKQTQPGSTTTTTPPAPEQK